MPRCTKFTEIELDDGTTVETHIIVDGTFDELFNVAEGKDVPGAWVIESWRSSYDEDLDDDQQGELNEKVEEIVFSEVWDFENAPDPDEVEDEVNEC